MLADPPGADACRNGADAWPSSNGKSLLPSGITGVEGDFRAGAAVEFGTIKEAVIGIGLVNYSADQIQKIRGLRSSQIESVLGQKTYDEVIHRDNLAITADDI